MSKDSIPDLSGHLTADEKKVRDIELAEQANKFFGGLTEEEKRLLGMETAHARAGSAAVLEAERPAADEALPDESPRASNGWADGAAAVLSLLAFIGILVWVIGSR